MKRETLINRTVDKINRGYTTIELLLWLLKKYSLSYTYRIIKEARFIIKTNHLK